MDVTALIETLLPAGPRPVEVLHLAIRPGVIVILIVCRDAFAPCPRCAQCSSRVHSRYMRTVTDLPWRGTPVILRWQVRRFFCDNVDCSRRIFAEQMTHIAPPRARTTPQLDEHLTWIGLTSGGEPGSRLAVAQGMPTSGDTILRRLRAMPVDMELKPRCIGIDDFAFRKGHCYGTVIVDHESGRVADLLPERSSESTAAWLSGQAQVETVTRDRSAIYANGISAGLPDAVQVADRFHLHMNLREAIVRMLDRYHCDITEAAKLAAESALVLPPTPPPMTLLPACPSLDSAAVASAAPSSPPPINKAVQQATDRRSRREKRYEEVVALDQAGVGIRKIARQMRMSRRTVTRFLRAGTFPERAKKHAKRSVDAFTNTLREMWDAGEHSAVELHRRIQSKGFSRSVCMVRRCVASWRDPAMQSRTSGPRPAPRPVQARVARISSNRLSWLLLRDEIKREPDEQSLIDQVRRACEPVRVAIDMAREFAVIFKEHQAERLAQWTDQVMQDGVAIELRGFAEGLVRDWSSVKPAIELPWSNGRAEGHVNRIKLIKRQMYGRAGFDLLRIRVMARGP